MTFLQIRNVWRYFWIFNNKSLYSPLAKQKLKLDFDWKSSIKKITIKPNL